jgi:hypothetical protein
LNDNAPRFGQNIFGSVSISTIIPVTQTLIADIYENEKGPIVFKNLGNSAIMAFDLDLGENATFNFQIISSNLDIFELNRHIIFDVSPNFINSNKPIYGVSNFNIYCVSPFDFDSLNAPITQNFNSTGASAKTIAFTVSD